MPPATNSSDQGLVVLASPEADKVDIKVDIVAVPGLAADPKRSFGSEKTSFNWLSHEKGIRAEIPDARVMLFEYDSRWYGDNALEQSVYNAASSLLTQLDDKRRDRERPLVFLAHSLGGLVVAKALTLAAARPDDLNRVRVYDCFVGAIFFGTPFQGSSEAGRAYMVAHMLEKIGKGVTSQILQFIDPKRDSLTELRLDFERLVKRDPKATIVCLYEMKKTEYLGKELGKLNFSKFAHTANIVVDKDSAILGGADEIEGFQCDHRQLNRFDSIEDGRYRSVRMYLRKIVDKAGGIVKKRLKEWRLTANYDLDSLMKSLHTVDFQRKREDVEVSSGVSSWIMKEQKYLQWSGAKKNLEVGESEPKVCLWISGLQGQGKSKAALAAIEQLEDYEKGEKRNAPEGKDVLLAYYFCDPKDNSTAVDLLKSLLWQLILKKPVLAQHARSLGVRSKSTRSNSSKVTFGIHKLWYTLQAMLQEPFVERVYFVINNLHYLPEDDTATSELLEVIRELLDGNQDDEGPLRQKARWMFLSRNNNYKHIRETLAADSLRGVLWINLEDGSKRSELRKSILLYTQRRVKKLAEQKGYSLALQYFVTSTLKQRAETNMLWVEVVCLLLGAIPANYIQVRKTMEALPQDLQALIEKVWKESLDVKTEDIHTTKEILRTLCILQANPTLNELKLLADLDKDMDGLKLQEQINACGPLIQTYASSAYGVQDIGEHRVRFIHELAREALVDRPHIRKLIGLSDDDKSEIKLQHGVVALRSFSHIIGQTGTDEDVFQWYDVDPTVPKESAEDKELDKLFPQKDKEEADGDETLSALEYPMMYWLDHANKATPDFVEILDLQQSFWSMQSDIRQSWLSEFSRKRLGDEDGTLKDLTSLHVAAYFGILPLVESLLASGHKEELSYRDSWANQPLHWAAYQGHAQVVEMLLEHGADVNDGAQDHSWTPLHMAASSGETGVMKTLLDEKHDVNINATASETGTPLALAIAYNEIEAAELLLFRGADPSVTLDKSDSAVAMAALRGHNDLIDKLLEKSGGAGTNYSIEYGTALAAAAATGQTEIVQALLVYDTDVVSREKALQEASKRGFQDIVKTLVKDNPVPQLNGNQALKDAAEGGLDQLITDLWEYHKSSEVSLSQEAVDEGLYLATDMQHASTVTLLLDTCGASADAEGEQYGNALTASAYDGTLDILQTLLSHGANINAEAGYALHAAASQGHCEIVKTLLEARVNVNFLSEHPDSSGTALQAACCACEGEVAQILLEHSADPNLGSGDFSNPITAACCYGLDKVVEALLVADADPNVQGGPDMSTPLINACTTLQVSSVVLLIQHGADVNKYDQNGDTALIASARLGNMECVKILLEHHADVDFCEKQFGTALHAAAAEGEVEVCKLLLKAGADPSIRGGPFDTVVQAAAASSDLATLQTVLELDPGRPWRGEIDINLQGGEWFTALHAAAAQEDSGCLRLLLKQDPKPSLDAVGPGEKGITALQQAILVRCNLNARLLLDAGADPNLESGKHATPLQAAALRGSVELCELLVNKGAKLDVQRGKYKYPLVAAVVRTYHEDDGDDDGEGHDVLDFLLEQEGIPAAAYQMALEKAFDIECSGAFKAIWKRLKQHGPDTLKPKMKSLLSRFQAQARKRTEKESMKEEDNGKKDIDKEDKNSDYEDDDLYSLDGQDIDSEYDSGFEWYDGSEDEDEENDEAGQGKEEQIQQGGKGPRGIMTLPIRMQTRGEGQQDGEPQEDESQDGESQDDGLAGS